MGIKHLWTIFSPFCERKPLYELQGKTVAIDLSCWICEAQNITEYQIQPRMYLRNLYFRTCFLLLMEVNPVFILEGKAPELKFDTIAARNAIQFKGAKPKTDGVKTGKDRSRFIHVLKRCEEMLRYMGLSCLTGKGEAESLCAYLNDEGLVDGCISQDSDCFAYGAKIVYRNFSIASQGAYSASGGAVDIYDITKINENMNFGRHKIIAMALLCGSDYSDGIHGVGKESVLKFFENIQDEEILTTLRSWRENTEKYDKFEKLINDTNICTSCGHEGKIQRHNKNGCGPCGMTKGCNVEKFKEERLKIKNEISMRSKALRDLNFPDEQLIQEFLIKKDTVSKLDLKWRQPDILKFIKFTTKFLQWEEIYAFEKILPILTRWQCSNCELLQTENLKGVLQPSLIKKVRNPKGIPSYEIVWTDPEEYLKGLIPEEQIEESKISLEKLWSTVEPQILVNKTYPKLVEEYQQSKIKPKKTTRRKKKDVNIEEIEGMLMNASISEPKPKRAKKITKNKKDELKVLESSFNELKLSKDTKKPTVLDSFLKQAVLKSQKNKNKQIELTKGNDIDDIIELDDNNCHTSTPSKSATNLMDISCFGDEENDEEISFIIQKIISRTPPSLQNLKKLNIQNIFQETHHSDEDIDILDNLKENYNEKKNNSSFFITGPVENDLFEKTFNEIKCSDDNDSTIEYDYDEIDFFHNNQENECKSKQLNEKENDDKEYRNDDLIDKNEFEKSDIKDDDSFCDIYVPLLDRLKKKENIF